VELGIKDISGLAKSDPNRKVTALGGLMSNTLLVQNIGQVHGDLNCKVVVL